MNKTNLVTMALLILLVALGTAIYLQYYKDGPVEIPVVEKPVVPPEPVKQPIVHYPVPETTDAAPEAEEQTPTQSTETAPPAPEQERLLLPATLPTVEDSDRSIQDALLSLIDNEFLYKLLFIENFIQRFVATVDNIPEKQLPRTHLPVKPPGGAFLVAGTTEAPQTSSQNQKRYTPYVNLLESLDQGLVTKIYVHFYPLFQQAYEQLGYKNSYFNDRLVYVIDHLLETPNPADPILLSQPGVLYTFADPLLERRSAGQKTLLRIGREQRERVTTVLKGYRQKLTNLSF